MLDPHILFENADEILEGRIGGTLNRRVMKMIKKSEDAQEVAKHLADLKLRRSKAASIIKGYKQSDPKAYELVKKSQVKQIPDAALRVHSGYETVNKDLKPLAYY